MYACIYQIYIFMHFRWIVVLINLLLLTAIPDIYKIFSVIIVNVYVDVSFVLCWTFGVRNLT